MKEAVGCEWGAKCHWVRTRILLATIYMLTLSLRKGDIIYAPLSQRKGSTAEGQREQQEQGLILKRISVSEREVVRRAIFLVILVESGGWV